MSFEDDHCCNDVKCSNNSEEHRRKRHAHADEKLHIQIPIDAHGKKCCESSSCKKNEAEQHSKLNNHHHGNCCEEEHDHHHHNDHHNHNHHHHDHYNKSHQHHDSPEYEKRIPLIGALSSPQQNYNSCCNDSNCKHNDNDQHHHEDHHHHEHSSYHQQNLVHHDHHHESKKQHTRSHQQKSSSSSCCSDKNCKDSKCNDKKSCNDSSCKGCDCCDEQVQVNVEDFLENSPNSPKNNDLRTATCTTLNVQGMSCCASCSKSIETHLIKQSGVLQVKVYFLSEKVVCYHDKHIISDDTLVREVNELGYTARILEEGGSNRANIQVDQVSAYRNIPVEDVIMNQKGIKRVHQMRDKSNAFTVEYNPDVTGVRTILENLAKSHILASLVTENSGTKVQSRGSDTSQWKRGFLFSLIFTIPIVILSVIIPLIPQAEAFMDRVLFLKSVTVKALVEFILTTPIQFIIAFPIYKSAYKALRFASANMDVLIAISTLAAYLYSIISVILAYFIETYKADYFFDTSAILITLVMLGRYLEVLAVGSTSDALSKLLTLQVPSATLVEKQELAKGSSSPCSSDEENNKENNKENNSNSNTIEREIEIALVQRRDILKVAPGARVPTDGFIVKGTTSIDESMVTGESLPVFKNVGDLVIGGTMNQTGMILMQCTKTVSETTLSSIYKLVEEAQVAKTGVQRAADRVAAWFVPFILLISIVTFLVWFLLAYFNVLPARLQSSLPPFPFALMFSMTVLVISCPCAIALSAPTAIMVATGVAASKFGILFKSAAIMEILHKVQTIVFDKTGTLTMGKPAVTDVITLQPTVSENELLFYAAVAEKGFTNHVLGQAVIQYAQEKYKKQLEVVSSQPEENILGQLENELPHSCHSEAGKGILAQVQGRQVLVGTLNWMQENKITVDDASLATVTKLQDEAKTIMLCALDSHLIGVLALADTLKNEAALVVQELKKQGKKVVMLTGDNEQTAKAIAHEVGIEHVFAQVLPSQKADKIKQLQQEGIHKNYRGWINSNKNTSNSGNIVLMVGDGINDAPSLTQANIGVSIASGTDIAVEASDIVLMKNDLRDLLVAIDLARVTFNRIRLNFVWAFIYNVIGIPFAAGATFPLLGWQLSPSLAGFSEVFSSIPVIISSLLLKFYSKPKVCK